MKEGTCIGFYLKETSFSCKEDSEKRARNREAGVFKSRRHHGFSLPNWLFLSKISFRAINISKICHFLVIIIFMTGMSTGPEGLMKLALAQLIFSTL